MEMAPQFSPGMLVAPRASYGFGLDRGTTSRMPCAVNSGKFTGCVNTGGALCDCWNEGAKAKPGRLTVVDNRPRRPGSLRL